MSILTKSIADELKHSVLEHKKFAKVIDEVLAKVMYDSSTGFCLVPGVTGVGKSTAMKRLAQIFTEYTTTDDGKGFLPPIMLKMMSPERKVFSWPDFYTESLRKNLNDPFVETRKNLNEMLSTYVREDVKKRVQARTIADLRRAFIDASNQRKCVALFIDEIQELCKVSGKDKAQDNLDVIKSLSDVIEVPVVCFGTSKAYEMLYLNEQTTRRADTVHFTRYSSDPDDIAEFNSILQNIELSLKIPLSDRFKGDIEFVYKHSLGCAGILMDWVKRSLAVAIKDRQEHIPYSAFDKKKLKPNQLESIARKIKKADEIHSRCDDFDGVGFLAGPQCYFAANRNAPKTGNGQSRPGERKPGSDRAGHLDDELGADLH